VNDDVACMQPWNPAAPFYADPNHQALFRCLVRSCDAAQFSTRELERIYGRLNPHTAIFGNQMSRPPVPRVAGAEKDAVVVGWGGSAGHWRAFVPMTYSLAPYARSSPAPCRRPRRR
jgi:hypothetical protein